MALALALNAAAHDKRDMDLVGTHGLQGRSSYQPVITRQGTRWFAYVGHHAGRALNPVTGAVETRPSPSSGSRSRSSRRSPDAAGAISSWW